MGFSGAAHGWGLNPLFKICHPYHPAIMKLDANINYSSQELFWHVLVEIMRKSRKSGG